MTFSEAQYDAIKGIYNQHQIENKALQAARREEIYKEIPRIAEIDQTIAMLSIEAARNKLKEQGDSTTQAKEDTANLIAEKEKLLTDHGYAKDYLKPIYTCPLCKDTGTVDNTYCSCYKQAVISLLYKQSTLDKIIETENYEHFDLSFYPKEPVDDKPFTPYENMSNILEKTKAFVEDFDEKKDGTSFLFYGETGLGKTYLSNCIAKAMLDTNHTVLYQSAIHLFEKVCADVLMNKNNNSESQSLYNLIFDCDLLIIDDLGTEFTNSFVSSTLYDILNTRLRNKKSTLISTNLDLKELTIRYSDRITTRIFASYEVYCFYGDNIRLAKRRQETMN